MLVGKMAGASLLAGVADDFILEGSVDICTYNQLSPQIWENVKWLSQIAILLWQME